MTTRDMSNNEAIQMLNRCMHEIAQLRTELDHLRPKAAAYDNLAIALHYARPSQGYGTISDDIIWTIQKRIDELTPKPEANPTPAPETINKSINSTFDPDPYSAKPNETPDAQPTARGYIDA